MTLKKETEVTADNWVKEEQENNTRYDLEAILEGKETLYFSRM